MSDRQTTTNTHTHAHKHTHTHMRAHLLHSLLAHDAAVIDRPFILVSTSAAVDPLVWLQLVAKLEGGFPGCL